MTPKKMNTFLKLSLTLLVVLVVIGLYFANQKLTTLAHDTARLKAKIEVSQKQIGVYEQAKQQVDSLGYVDELANKVLPERENQSVVVAELSQFALRSRLSVAQITFPQDTKKLNPGSKTTVKTPAGVAVVPAVIEFKEGTKYENVLEFLRTIENNRRKMQVTNVSFTPDEENKAVFSKVSVSMNLYTRAEK